MGVEEKRKWTVVHLSEPQEQLGEQGWTRECREVAVIQQTISLYPLTQGLDLDSSTSLELCMTARPAGYSDVLLILSLGIAIWSKNILKQSYSDRSTLGRVLISLYIFPNAFYVMHF